MADSFSPQREPQYWAVRKPWHSIRLPRLAVSLLAIGGGLLASGAALFPCTLSGFLPLLQATGANTLFSLALLAGGLFAREHGWTRQWSDAAAGIVCLLVLETPLQALVGADVADGPLRLIVDTDRAPGVTACWPGRMSMFDTFALMLAAICLVALPRLDDRRAVPLWLSMLVALYALVLIGMLGMLVGIPLLVDPWGRVAQMGLVTAFGLLVVVAVLARQAVARPAVAGYFEQRPDRIVFSVSFVGLLTVLLLGGMLSSGVLARSGLDIRRFELSEAMLAHLALADSEIATLRAVLEEVERGITRGGGPVPDRSWTASGTDLRIESRRPVKAESEGLPLDARGDTVVFLRQGWWLRAQGETPDERRIVAERRFVALERLTARIAAKALNGRIVLCAPVTVSAQPTIGSCVADSGEPVGARGRWVAGGERSPMLRALAGESGLTVLRDRHQREMLAVFAPLQGLPLGVVLEVDLVELQAGIRHTLWWVAVAILLASVGGGGLIYRHIQPLVSRLGRVEGRVKFLLESVPVGVLAAERDGAIYLSNQAAQQMFAVRGRGMAGRTVQCFLPGIALPPGLFAVGRDRLAVATFEIDAVRTDGSSFPTEVAVRAYEYEGVPRLVFIVQDITDRRAADRALRRTEQALRRAQEVAHVGSGCVEADGTVYWSEETYRILGIAPGTPLDLSGFLACIHPDDRDGVEMAWRAGLGGTAYDIKHRVRDGDVQRWVRTRAESERRANGMAGGMTVTIEDITEGTLREAELLASRHKLRELAAHRERVREDERNHIAREIHDELGQHLTALRMDASLLRIHFGAGNPGLVTRVDEMKALIDETIKVVRSVASSLRPPVLDLGLPSAAEWLASDFRQRTGVPCTLTVSPDGDALLDDARATAVFRILQESLTNIRRHACARSVAIRIWSPHTGLLQLEVKDDGVGFDPAVVREKKTFGLMGLRERAIMFGGNARFISRPGEGTVMRADIPLTDIAGGGWGWCA